jgi:hypothetical protein
MIASRIRDASKLAGTSSGTVATIVFNTMRLFRRAAWRPSSTLGSNRLMAIAILAFLSGRERYLKFSRSSLQDMERMK